jgi:seryl-tRNA(Sec) selenium transferase
MPEVKTLSRRDVLKQSAMISAAGALAPAALAATTAKAATTRAGVLKAGQVLAGREAVHTQGDFHTNLFTEIGVRPLINCRGTLTAISGSVSLPEVKQAMYNASLYHVRMDEMMTAVGAELGKLCGAEWGVAVTGTAAATCLATVACMAGTDVEKSQALPYVRKKDQVLIPRTSRNAYDIGVRMTGAEIVEFVSPEELRTKMNDRCAMMYILHNPRYNDTPMSTKSLIAVAHEKNIPVYVDAAATEPNTPNIHIEAGADLVAYSGGKCMRGPQSSGLVIGKKDLCQAIYFQSAPHHNYGRAMKCSKEETMGLLAAVRAWQKRDHDAEQKMWVSWCQSIGDRMQGLPSVKTSIIPAPSVDSIDRCPGIRIAWDANTINITGTEMVKVLDDAPTRIVLNGSGSRPDHMESAVTIFPYIMTPAEVKIVADAVYKLLKNPPHFENPVIPAGTPASLAGKWDVIIHYVRGTGEQHFTLKQEGNTVTGDHQGELYNGSLRGSVHANQVAFLSSFPVSGNRLTFSFKGAAEGNRMSGTVAMAEYGEVPWEAIRS